MDARRFIATLLCLTLATSCSTAPFQNGKPVTHSSFPNAYRQNDERIDRGELVDFLKSRPTTEAAVRTSETLRWVAIVPITVGGGLFIYKLGEGFAKGVAGGIGAALGDPGVDYNPSLFWVGLFTLAVGGGIAVIANSYLNSAVDTYNEELAQQKPSSRLQPWIVPRPDGGTAGVVLRF